MNHHHLLSLILLVCFSYVTSFPVDVNFNLKNICPAAIFGYKNTVVNSYYEIALEFTLSEGSHRISQSLAFKEHFSGQEAVSLETYRSQFNDEIKVLFTKYMSINNFLSRNFTVSYNRLNEIKKAFESISSSKKETEQIKVAKQTKDIKETKEEKEPKVIKEAKETEKAKKTKDIKETKESKETKEAKETKKTKEPKETKEEKEPKETKEAKDDKKSKPPTGREKQLKTCIDTVDSGLKLVTHFKSFQTEFVPKDDMSAFNKSIEELAFNMNKNTEQLVFTKEELLERIHQIGIFKPMYIRSESLNAKYIIEGRVFIPMYNLNYDSFECVDVKVLTEFYKSKGKIGVKSSTSGWASTHLNFNMFAVIQLSILYYFIKNKF